VARIGSYPQFPQGVRSISGPEYQAALEQLPGEFVSEEMRADCARFLEELRAVISRRNEVSEGPAWGPSEQSGPYRPAH
jgi:hypothetical protein